MILNMVNLLKLIGMNSKGGTIPVELAHFVSLGM